MGKSKAKKAQRYPTPSDRYLIVTDPWGGVPIHEPDFFNNVTAWFEIMLKSKYPGVRPSAIYYQWTNKNIVIELPDHVDATSLLGAHYWKDFLIPPHCFRIAERASYIYEFDYKNHHIPPAAGGWTPGYARYSKIRPDFYVREPYPPSRRAKNSSLAFAKKLPPEKLLLPGQEDLPPLPPGIPELEELDDKAEGSSSGGVVNGPNQKRDNSLTMDAVYNEREVMDPVEKSTRDLRRSQAREECSFTTKSNPDNFQSHHRLGHSLEETEDFHRDITPKLSPNSFVSMGKKIDPYEEEDRAMEFLRFSSFNATTATMTTTTGGTPSSPAISAIKQEPSGYSHSTNDSNVGYVPSTELQAAFASLNELSNEEEDVKPQIKKNLEDYGYAPSEDLLSALASLPSDMVDFSSAALSSDHQGNTGRGETRVKSEPRDNDDDASHLLSPKCVPIKREPESPDHGLFKKKIKLEQ